MLTRPKSTFSFQTYLKPSKKEPLSPDPRCLARCSSGFQSSRNTVTAVNSCIAAVDVKRIPSHPTPITTTRIPPNRRSGYPGPCVGHVVPCCGVGETPFVHYAAQKRLMARPPNRLNHAAKHGRNHEVPPLEQVHVLSKRPRRPRAPQGATP